MEKNSWKTIYTLTKTAKIYASSNVEWEDRSGKKYSGKVKQILSDRVSVRSDDGTIHIVSKNILRKVIR
jgi:hypothetical protein